MVAETVSQPLPDNHAPVATIATPQAVAALPTIPAQPLPELNEHDESPSLLDDVASSLGLDDLLTEGEEAIEAEARMPETPSESQAQAPSMQTIGQDPWEERQNDFQSHEIAQQLDHSNDRALAIANALVQKPEPARLARPLPPQQPVVQALAEPMTPPPAPVPGAQKSPSLETPPMLAEALPTPQPQRQSVATSPTPPVKVTAPAETPKAQTAVAMAKPTAPAKPKDYPSLADIPQAPEASPDDAQLAMDRDQWLQQENEPATPSASLTEAESSFLQATHAAPEMEAPFEDSTLMASIENEQPAPLPEALTQSPRAEATPQELTLENLLPDSSPAGDHPAELALPTEEPTQHPPEVQAEYANLTVPEPLNTVTAAPKPQVKTNNTPPPKDEEWFPGVKQTFKKMLGDDTPKPATPTLTPPAPASGPTTAALPSMDMLANDPPATLTQSDGMPAALPSMNLLNETSQAPLPSVALTAPQIAEPSIALPTPEMEDMMAELAQPEIAEEELAFLSAPEITAHAPAIVPPKKQAKPAASAPPQPSDLQITYGKEATDIPAAEKERLKKLATKAKKSQARLIVSTYASGTPEESKAANMISLSRGLSLRAFFIDEGIEMDQIIVQAKGLDNPGGASDRADILVQ